MPLTSPNTHFFTSSTHRQFLVDIVEALCGGVGTLPSTVTWTVVDSWDGTTRQVPTDGLLANSSTAWAPGGGIPPDGSWIVLQSLPGERAAQFQCKWTLTSAFVQSVQMYPYADWVPGSGTGPSPTIPTRATPVTSITHGSSVPVPTSLVWDASVVVIGSVDTVGVSSKGTYVGEVHPHASAVDDPRPFVHTLTAGTTGWDAAAWYRVSPVDDTTTCTVRGAGTTGTGQDAAEIPSYGAFLTPVRLYTTQAGHKAYIGVARHIANIPRPHSTARTTWGESLGVRDWISFGLGAGHLAMRHDGSVQDFDHLRTPLAEDQEGAGYILVREHPRMVRTR